MEKIPIEIWSKIFGYLDFDTVQKTATLVCKSWLHMIRNDSVLSGGLALNSIDKMKIFEINNVLSKWTHLKSLRIFNNWHPHWDAKGPNESHLLLFRDTEFDLNLKEIEPFLCPWLKKIIIPINIIPTFLPSHNCAIVSIEITTSM